MVMMCSRIFVFVSGQPSYCLNILFGLSNRGEKSMNKRLLTLLKILLIAFIGWTIYAIGYLIPNGIGDMIIGAIVVFILSFKL